MESAVADRLRSRRVKAVAEREPVLRQLYEGRFVGIADWYCPPKADVWLEENRVESSVPLVAFPRKPVLIQHTGSEPLLATPNEALFHNPGQEYRRDLRSPSGDHSLLLQLQPEAVKLLELATNSVRDGRLTVGWAPVRQQNYLDQHALLHLLEGGKRDEPLIEDVALRLAGSVLSVEGRPQPTRNETVHEHHQLAERAKELIAGSIEESTSLRQLANGLGVSQFHLARVFRAHTGFAIHDYRTTLRLRLALEELPAARGNIARLAAGLGFASHSHFTDSFRREFGMPPSAAGSEAAMLNLLRRSVELTR